MRQASKNILYTVVNSRAYDTSAGVSLPTWEIGLICIDVAIGALLVLLEVLAVRKYNRQKKEAQA